MLAEGDAYGLPGRIRLFAKHGFTHAHHGIDDCSAAGHAEETVNQRHAVGNFFAQKGSVELGSGEGKRGAGDHATFGQFIGNDEVFEVDKGRGD